MKNMPLTNDKMVKECSRCGLFLRSDKFRTRIQYGKPYIIARCRKCEHEVNRIQRDPEKARLAERRRFSNPKRRDVKNEFQRGWRKNNIEKNRAYHRKNIKKNVDEMTDLYIRRMLFHVKPKMEVPKDLIELKRKNLALKRAIKKNKDESKN